MCKHVNTQIRCKTASDGARLYAYQCLDCHRPATKWIDHASPLVKAGAPPWIEEPERDPRQMDLFGGKKAS